jgi:hypothetical protein
MNCPKCGNTIPDTSISVPIAEARQACAAGGRGSTQIPPRARGWLLWGVAFSVLATLGGGWLLDGSTRRLPVAGGR